MRFVNRGGNWNNGTNAGVFNLNANNSRTNANTNIGFRSALRLLGKRIVNSTELQPKLGLKEHCSALPTGFMAGFRLEGFVWERKIFLP